LLFLAATAWAQTAYDGHVLFDHSPTDTAYFYATATVDAPSALANVRGKLPVETTRVHGPPNGLRLAWTSRTGGAWRAVIQRESWRNQSPMVGGDTLAFWAYTNVPISKAALPLLGVLDAQGIERVLQLGDYLDGIAQAVGAGRPADPHPQDDARRRARVRPRAAQRGVFRAVAR